MTDAEVFLVDPRELCVPSSRREGADPGKLARQTSRYRDSITDMPPIWVHSIQQDKYLISDGVTRATLAALLCSHQLVPAIDIGFLNVSPKRYSTSRGEVAMKKNDCLVPKLRLGTHFRETLFRKRQSRALQDVCSQAGAWEQVHVLPPSDGRVAGALTIVDEQTLP